MRVAFSVVLLAIALGSAGALAVWSMRAAPGETGTYVVTIVGPDGPLDERTVDVANATALTALLAAAEEAQLAIVLEEYPIGTYVRSIGGHRAAGPSGWIYEVHRDGVWLSGDRSSAEYPLQKGDALRWSWTSG